MFDTQAASSCQLGNTVFTDIRSLVPFVRIFTGVFSETPT